MDVISEFLAALTAAGYRPKSGKIEADNAWHRLYFMDEKSGRDSGRYSLKIMPDGFAFGSFGSDKDPGGFHTWHSRKKEKMTPADRAALTERLRKERHQAEAERNAAHKIAAAEALTYWKGLSAGPGTPYSERKSILVEMARQDGESLVVPLFADGQLWGLQVIRPDGSKEFRKGCRVQGCYCPLATKDEDKSVILIVEGFATGCSVRMATGLPVIVAFNAGNLSVVAKAIRTKYPGSAIIICADNDRWTFTRAGRASAGGPETKDVGGSDPRWVEWRAAGYMTNPGLEKANKAAVVIGGAHVVWPDLGDDPEKRTDFNDMHALYGLDAVRDRILAVVPFRQPDEAPDGILGPGHDLQPVGGDFHPPDNFDPRGYDPGSHLPDWRELAIWKQRQNGDPVLDADKSWNYGVLIEHLLPGVFAFDEFRLAVIMVRCPPWIDREQFRVHEVEDSDLVECDYWLQKRGLNGSDLKTRAAIYRAALMNTIHPAKDYFNSLKWDGVPRLDNWLIEICGAESDDVRYLRAVGSKWIIAGVKRVFEPGCQFDHMLLLEGRQAAYKSSALRELATFGDKGLEEEYFTDNFSLRDSKNKDELLKLWGCLIIEIGEMAGFGTTDIDTVKNFITIRSDKVRIPYAKLPKVFKRQFIFAGTRNPIGGIFSDPTGSRRFWPVEVGRINIAMLKRDKNQLWAEAVSRYKGGETLQLTEELYKLCEEAAQARRIIDEWTDDVLEKVGSKDFVTSAEVMKLLGLQAQFMTRKERERIQDILKSNGFEYKRKWAGKKQIWGWKRAEGQVKFSFVGDEPEEEVAF